MKMEPAMKLATELASHFGKDYFNESELKLIAAEIRQSYFSGCEHPDSVFIPFDEADIILHNALGIC